MLIFTSTNSHTKLACQALESGKLFIVGGIFNDDCGDGGGGGGGGGGSHRCVGNDVGSDTLQLTVVL